MDLTSFLEFLKLGLAVPGSIIAGVKLVRKLKPEEKIPKKEYGTLLADLELSRERILNLFRLHHELNKWKRLHQRFQDFLQVAGENGNIFHLTMRLPKSEEIVPSRVQAAWEKETMRRPYRGIKAQVYPIFLDMEPEQKKAALRNDPIYGDAYSIAVDNKNNAIQSVKAFSELTKEFDVGHKGDPSVHRDWIMELWFHIHQNATDALAYGNIVLINLIELLGKAFHEAETQIKASTVGGAE